MKTRLGLLIVLVGVLWGCGSGPTEVGHEVIVAPVVTPAITPVPTVGQQPSPTKTPVCRIRKLCE